VQRATDATPSLPQDYTSAASSVGSAEARSGNGAGPAAAEGDVLIELHDVGKAFGKKAILKGATMKIRRGEAVGIIGALLACGSGANTASVLVDSHNAMLCPCTFWCRVSELTTQTQLCHRWPHSRQTAAQAWQALDITLLPASLRLSRLSAQTCVALQADPAPASPPRCG